MIREDLSEEVAFKQRPEGSERDSHDGIWRKSLPGRKNKRL